jgi:O-acetyl-ADP-ribose deacetylase (regulator of RNase III)
VRFIAQPGRSCCTSVASWAGAEPATPNSRVATDCPPNTSSTLLARSGVGGVSGEPELLASCYRRSLELAAANGILTLAFPSISTGIYGYPIEFAAKVAVSTVHSSLHEFAAIQEVVFCCFSPNDLLVYEGVLSETARNG